MPTTTVLEDQKLIPHIEQMFKPAEAAWWAARYVYFTKKKALRGVKVEDDNGKLVPIRVPTLDELVESQVDLALTCKDVFEWRIGKRELRNYIERRLRQELAHKDVAYWVNKEPKKRDVESDDEE